MDATARSEMLDASCESWFSVNGEPAKQVATEYDDVPFEVLCTDGTVVHGFGFKTYVGSNGSVCSAHRCARDEGIIVIYTDNTPMGDAYRNSLEQQAKSAGWTVLDAHILAEDVARKAASSTPNVIE